MADALRVVATAEGGWATRVTMRSHDLISDEPATAGGQDSGPMPTELLCAALASCFSMALVFAAAKRGKELPDLRVTVDAERAGRDLRYGRLRVEAEAAVATDELARLVKQARRFCWVSNTLAEDLRVEYFPTVLHARPLS
ncbi:MAG TPA: OsmC family protein [Solirubrobacteraceae bacterium]|nr:OsmC family protein [Solirubrobacteraceae bacterium]